MTYLRTKTILSRGILPALVHDQRTASDAFQGAVSTGSKKRAHYNVTAPAAVNDINDFRTPVTCHGKTNGCRINASIKYSYYNSTTIPNILRVSQENIQVNRKKSICITNLKKVSYI
jgi:hypothetical protein